MKNIATASITDLMFRKAIKNDCERNTPSNIKGLNMDRLDSNHPDYHLLPNPEIEQQYEAFLTDPRRI
jgi:hypothetical protein